MIRTVLGDRDEVDGLVYAHEHLIIDSPLIEDRWPHILLDSVEGAVAELAPCRAAGVRLVVDAMPVSSGRDPVRLAAIARASGVDVVAVTGLHHDRYYGPRHWTNRVGADALTELFVADLLQGMDEHDYTGPVVARTPYRAGLIKLATSGGALDARDARVSEAVTAAALVTGAPVLTHCEDGRGALEQVSALTDTGLPASALVLSHVDKARDLGYAKEVAATGAYLELDQCLRQAAQGSGAFAVDVVVELVACGFERRIVLGTDGARRSLWATHGGSPGLAWLATGFRALLAERGLSRTQLDRLYRENPVRALSWRAPSPGPLA